MNNDRVMVRVENRRKREARVVRILERTTKRLVGRIDIQGSLFFIQSRSRSVHQNFIVSQEDRGTLRDGDLVIAEIITFPADYRPGTAKVLKVLGEAENLAAEVEAIIEEHNLPRRFPRRYPMRPNSSRRA